MKFKNNHAESTYRFLFRLLRSMVEVTEKYKEYKINVTVTLTFDTGSKSFNKGLSQTASKYVRCSTGILFTGTQRDTQTNCKETATTESWRCNRN